MSVTFMMASLQKGCSFSWHMRAPPPRGAGKTGGGSLIAHNSSQSLSTPPNSTPIHLGLACLHSSRLDSTPSLLLVFLGATSALWAIIGPLGDKNARLLRP